MWPFNTLTFKPAYADVRTFLSLFFCNWIQVTGCWKNGIHFNPDFEPSLYPNYSKISKSWHRSRGLKPRFVWSLHPCTRVWNMIFQPRKLILRFASKFNQNEVLYVLKTFSKLQVAGTMGWVSIIHFNLDFEPSLYPNFINISKCWHRRQIKPIFFCDPRTLLHLCMKFQAIWKTTISADFEKTDKGRYNLTFF